MGKSRQEQRRQSARLETEIREYVHIQGQRRRLFPRAMLVGLLAGGVAVVFRWVLEDGDAWRDWLLVWAHRYPTWGWLLPTFVGALGVGLAVFLVRAVAPEAAGSGIPHLKAVLARLRSMRWQTVLPVKFVGGGLGISSGLALRRDGSALEAHAPLIAEFTVQEGARFDGKQVHALELPAGCVLVTVHRDRYEMVPTPNTRLEVENRLTVVIAPQATEALEVLRKGCEAPRTHD